MSHANSGLRTAFGRGGTPRRFRSCLLSAPAPARRREQRTGAESPAGSFRGRNPGQGEAARSQGGSGQNPHRRRTGSPRVSGTVTADRKAPSSEGGELRPQGRGSQPARARARHQGEVAGRDPSAARRQQEPAGKGAPAGRQHDPSGSFGDPDGTGRAGPSQRGSPQGTRSGAGCSRG